MVTLHIGFDDTDSPKGGCTTYIAALLVEKLLKLGARFKDYPNLIRLNPNVPWKTRGNGALCLRVMCPESVLDAVFEAVADTVEENSDLRLEGTDPGIVFFQCGEIPQELKDFARRTIRGIVKMEQALELLREFHAEALGYGTGLGIVGALAAIGETLETDHTYEIIAYRTPRYRGSNRLLDQRSMEKMNQEASQTFNNIDSETGRVLIAPRGPDPILYGIRGETPEGVIRAHRMVKPLEPVERWVIFRTNHGTDAHLEQVEAINEIQPYHTVVVTGQLDSEPMLVPKRHRIFRLRDETGEVDCAAYEPTGALRKIAGQLRKHDLVEVAGGVRPPSKEHITTINLEKLRVVKLAPRLVSRNPRCPKCGKRMSSMGTDQGLRCPKCGLRSSKLRKLVSEEKREVSEGLFITSPRSQRHLTKPHCRYGREKVGRPDGMLSYWHDP
jgi:tRNA(Ile2)-agmatinylcytidine synthase